MARNKFNMPMFMETLDVVRRERLRTWVDVSQLTGISTTTLSRMQNGRVPNGAALVVPAHWAGINPTRFVVPA